MASRLVIIHVQQVFAWVILMLVWLKLTSGLEVGVSIERQNWEIYASLVSDFFVLCTGSDISELDLSNCRFDFLYILFGL